MRSLFYVFVFATLALVALFGTGYASLALNWLTPGTTVAAFSDANGPGTMTMGTNLQRPDWLKVPADATVLGGALVVSGLHPDGFGSVEVMTRASLDEVRGFYLHELKHAGFDVRDMGIAPLNAATAAYLGIDGSIIGEREATRDCLTVQIRSADGWLVPSRVLQIAWYKTDARFQIPREQICLGRATAKSRSP